MMKKLNKQTNEILLKMDIVKMMNIFIKVNIFRNIVLEIKTWATNCCESFL